MKLLFIALSLFFLSCTVQNKPTDHDFSIVGKWEIVSVDFTGDRSNIKPASKPDLHSLFGPNTWSQSIGKYIEFYKNDIFESNILPPDIEGNFTFHYSLDEQLSVSIRSEEDASYYHFIIPYSSKSDDHMALKLNDNITVVMRRL